MGDDDVIVGWDGSAAADRAAGWAAGRQREGGGAVRLLQVRAPDRAADPDLAARDRTRLALEVAALRERNPGLEITGSRTVGDPGAALAEASAEAMLVIGARARPDGTRRPPVRPFAIQVASTAPGPVVLVPDLLAEPVGDRVVAAVDGSAASLSAALAAAEEAERCGQPLLVVHAWSPRLVRGALLPLDGRVVGTMEDAHRRVLDESVDLVARRHPDLEITGTLVSRPPAEAIADAGRFASLVVLGRHAGVVLVPSLLGSVAGDVLARAVVPTMVVGAPPAPTDEHRAVRERRPAGV